MIDAELRELIRICWDRGDSIGEARKCIRRTLGRDVDFHTIQRAFADISWRAFA